MADPVVLAKVGRDCAERLRVIYRVPAPLGPQHQRLLAEASVTLTPFSSMVAGARDHVRLSVGAGLQASFAVGTHDLVVVYGKLAGALPHALVRLMESRIEAEFGPIEWG